MNYNLVIVDDDPEFIFLHKLLSSKAGFYENPKTFKGGQEVINYISENFNNDLPNHLIFLDIYMAEVDGWKVLDYLNTLNRPDKIKVILISSSVNLDDKRKAIKYDSVIEYIEKPLLLEYLVNLKSQVIF